jgi:hypothetical protein
MATPVVSSTFVTKPSSSIKRLTATKIVDRHKDG